MIAGFLFLSELRHRAHKDNLSVYSVARIRTEKNHLTRQNAFSKVSQTWIEKKLEEKRRREMVRWIDRKRQKY